MKSIRRPANRSIKKPITFAYAIRSFLGYLEGTGKSSHTIKNYRLDLLSFQNFTVQIYGERSPAALVSNDIELFHDHLMSHALKTNTRRRILLTVRRFLKYLALRKAIPTDAGAPIPTPHKIERIPWTVSSESLLQTIRELPALTDLEARNRVLLWTLAETGCLVSEIGRIRYEDWTTSVDGKKFLKIEGKSPRLIEVSGDLYEAASELKLDAENSPWLFIGHNRFGPLGGSITPRGVELLVRHFASKSGMSNLTPRTFRHSAVIRWLKSGMKREDVQRRLGLKTLYAFRSYELMMSENGEPLLKSKSSATSISETPRPES